jgi:hypothetical protein
MGGRYGCLGERIKDISSHPATRGVVNSLAERHKYKALARAALARLDDWQDKQVDYTPPDPLAPPPGPSGGGRHEREKG